MSEIAVFHVGILALTDDERASLEGHGIKINPELTSGGIRGGWSSEVDQTLADQRQWVTIKAPDEDVASQTVAAALGREAISQDDLFVLRARP